jgi:hypothetical protein
MDPTEPALGAGREKGARPYAQQESDALFNFSVDQPPKARTLPSLQSPLPLQRFPNGPENRLPIEGCPNLIGTSFAVLILSHLDHTAHLLDWLHLVQRFDSSPYSKSNVLRRGWSFRVHRPNGGGRKWWCTRMTGKDACVERSRLKDPKGPVPHIGNSREVRSVPPCPACLRGSSGSSPELVLPLVDCDWISP